MNSFQRMEAPSARSTDCEKLSFSIEHILNPTFGSRKQSNVEESAEYQSPFDKLPQQCQDMYVGTYSNLMFWKKERNIDKDCFSEAVMLEFFRYLKSKFKLYTLHNYYSMLKIAIKSKHNIDINYPEVVALLEKSLIGVQLHNPAVFHPIEIRRFLNEAKDSEFLAVKVIVIFLIYSPIRIVDLTNVDVNDVKEERCKKSSVFVIKFRDGKTNSICSFTVADKCVAFLRIYKQMRPANTPHSRFFLNYQNGRCTVQPIENSAFLGASKVVANFLYLDAQNYSCLSFQNESIPYRKKTGSTEAIATSTITRTVDAKEKRMMEDKSIREIFCENVKTLESLPTRLREMYVKSYENFLAWKIDKKIENDCVSDAVVLEYLKYLKTKYRPSLVNTEFSMLSAIIQQKENIDINYPKVQAFLNDIDVGYQPRKCYLFRQDDLLRFLFTADDRNFLEAKVIMIFGIHGIYSASELANVDVKDVIDVIDVEQETTYLLIKSPKRNLSITVQSEYATYIRKYMKLRPKITNHSHFFVNFHNGKCTVQPFGVTRFHKAPKAIAHFLNLDPENYTSYSFRSNSLNCGVKRMSNDADSSVEELVPKKARINMRVSVQNNYDRPAFQVPPQQVQSHQFFGYNPRHIPVTSTITTSFNTATVPPTSCQPYYVQSQQVEPYPLLQYGTGAVYVKPNDVYVQPNNATNENNLQYTQL